MVKIHSFFGAFLVTFMILCLLIGVMVFYNIQSNNVQELALKSMTLLSDWNKLENRTNQILLSRYTVTDKTIHPLIQTWKEEYDSFSTSLEQLSEDNQINHWPHLIEQINGATRIWRYTKVQLNNANNYFNKIIQSGLGDKVMVNGFIHTMYKLRMEGQLTDTEIFLIDDTLYALESLDKATREFDLIFNAIVVDLKDTGNVYLKRIRFMIFGLFCMAILVLCLALLINNQLKIAQENRSLYLKRQKGQLLRSLCENSCLENMEQFNRKKMELGIQLSLDDPILPIILQIDNYSIFSHKLNLKEQNSIIEDLTRTAENYLAEEALSCESFIYRDDMIIILSNTQEREEIDGFLEHMRVHHKNLIQNQEWSVSMTIGSINNDAIDLDNDFSDLLELSEYRFLQGEGAFIFPGSSQLSLNQTFRYPKEKERILKDCINSLKIKPSLKTLDDMIDFGSAYGPRNMRRLFLRLTASLISIVENLEQTYHIPSMTDVIPMMLQVQNPENIDGVKEILRKIINQIINSCIETKEEKHDQTVLKIKNIIKNEMNNLNLSAETIADKFDLTASYLNRLFKQHNSYSIAGYINIIRLEFSEELLRCTDKNVSEIAELSGFASAGTFFRLFKKKYGRTPKDYQREIKQRESSIQDEPGGF
ncbi:MAG: helix-turn-helix transcriptional regulator [Spirochaetales bacterium]|nr:helix-turn-helix transcriptional regulator [Spirochaetales bacterium]